MDKIGRRLILRLTASLPLGLLCHGLQHAHGRQKAAVWETWPGTRMDGIFEPYDFDLSFHGTTGPECMQRAWSGGAYGFIRRDGEPGVFIHGGGHGDYGGNGVFFFGLTSRRWRRLKNHSAVWPAGQDPQPSVNPRNPDGSPRAIHSYTQIEFVPDINGSPYFVRHCGEPWPNADVLNEPTFFGFNLDTLKWDLENSDYTFLGGYSGNESQIVYDGDRDVVWVVTPVGILKWTPATNRMTSEFVHKPRLGMPDRESTICYHPPTGRVYFVGTTGGTRKQVLRYFNADNPAGGYTFVDSSAKGDTELLWSHSPGVAYDPRTDHLVCYPASLKFRSGEIQPDIFVVDVATHTISRRAIAGLVPPAISGGRTYRRFGYSSELGLLYLIQGVDADVRILRGVLQ